MKGHIAEERYAVRIVGKLNGDGWKDVLKVEQELLLYKESLQENCLDKQKVGKALRKHLVGGIDNGIQNT